VNLEISCLHFHFDPAFLSAFRVVFFARTSGSTLLDLPEPISNVGSLQRPLIVVVVVILAKVSQIVAGALPR